MHSEIEVCHEKLRLSARIRLLSDELQATRDVLHAASGTERETWLRRQYQTRESWLIETEAQLARHINEHGC